MKQIFLTMMGCIFLLMLQAQNVAINNDGSAADPKAILDIKSNNKGILLPRIGALSDITGSVPLGLIVFVTNGERGLYYNASALPGAPNWKKIGVGDNTYWQYTPPNYLFWNETGNVGIGTSSPSSKLVVKTNNQGITQENADGNMQIGFYTNSTIGALLQTNTNHPLKFSTNNGLPQVTLLVNGNFGVGTDSPSYKITSRGDGSGIVQESSNGLVKVGFYTNTSGAYLETKTNHPLNFTTNNGGSQMQLSVSGNLGIGTQAPVRAGLVVDKKVGATNALFGSNATGISIESAYPGIGLNTYWNNGRFFISNGAGGYIGLNPTNARISFANTAGIGTPGAQAPALDKMYIDFDGTVHLGSSNLAAEDLTKGTGYKLRVYGKALAEEVRVQLKGAWPDYVFTDSYRVLPISELDQFIKKYKHLPNIAKAEVLEKEGIELGEMQRKMMEKIEELTLYIIDLKTQLDQQQSELQEMKTKKQN